MYKKIGPAVVLVFVLLSLTACGQKKAAEGVEKKSPKGGFQVVNDEQIDGVTENKQDEGDKKIKKTPKELLKMGKAQKCSFTGSVDGGNVSGISYIDGQKLRQDVKMDMEGIENEVHLFMENKTAYSWGTLTPGKGTKMTIEDNEDSVDANEESSGEGSEKDNIGDDIEYDYDCEDWKVDPSLFVLPTDVEFIDFNETMDKIEDITGSMSPDGADEMAAMCDICDMSPNAEECKKDLECK